MTVSSEVSQVSYDTDGVTTAFLVPFYFLANDHLRVWLYNESTGVETDLVLGSAYTVAGAGNPAGGIVTTTTAYTAGPLLRIERVVPITQETAYQRNDPFPERAHERALDKLTMICQQLAGFFGLLPGSTLRALLLGRNDIDGQGAYRARNNRIQDLADPINPQDATNQQWVQAQIARLATDGSGQVVLDMLADPRSTALGDALIAVRQTFDGAGDTTQHEKNSNRVDLTDFEGVDKTGVADCARAFQAADALFALTSISIFVPYGTYRTTYLPNAKFFGFGVVRFGAETLHLDPAIPTRINTSGTPVDPEIPEQVERYMNLIAGPRAGAAISSVQARASTIFAYEGLLNCTEPARATGFGKQVFKNATSVYSSDAFGADSCGQGTYLNRVSGFGANTLKWAGSADPVAVAHDFYRVTSTGTGDFLDAIGFTAPGRWPTIRADYLGSISSPNPARIPTGPSQVIQSVAAGRNALLHSLKTDSDTALGVNAMAHAMDTYDNTAVGTRANRDGVASNRTVAVGTAAMQSNMTGYWKVAVGNEALFSSSHTFGDTAIGFQTLSSLTGTATGPTTTGARRNTGVGIQALVNLVDGFFNAAGGTSAAAGQVGAAFSNTAAWGASCLAALGTGANQNSGLNRALENLVSGTNNTGIGYLSGRLMWDGTNCTTISNSTILGANAAVSGSNQVQLGDSATTTYAYGSVQNRSDARDKTDIQDTVLGLEFIEKLRPVDFKWDMREDYLETVERTRLKEVIVQRPSSIMGPDGEPIRIDTVEYEEEIYYETIVHPKDGSRKRVRNHHGLIAQEVQAVMADLGIDFGGLQDHTVNGGIDRLSIGYSELIGPLIKAVQQLSARVKVLEAK